MWGFWWHSWDKQWNVSPLCEEEEELSTETLFSGKHELKNHYVSMSLLRSGQNYWAKLKNVEMGKKKKGKKSKWEFSTEDMKHVVQIPCLPWEKIRTSTSDTCMSSFVSFLGNSWWTLSNRNPEVIFFLIIFQILGFLIYKVSS